MPQFDPANFSPQIIWLAALFAILYFVVIRLSLPRISGVIDARSRTIEGDIQAAQTARDQAAAAEAAYLAGLQRAREQAHAATHSAAAAAQEEVAARLKATEAEMNAQLAAADARIHAAKQDAFSSLDAVAGELAVTIVERLTGAGFAGEMA